MGDKSFNDKLNDHGVWKRICDIEYAIGIKPDEKLDMAVLEMIKKIRADIEALQSVDERNQSLNATVDEQAKRIEALEKEKKAQAEKIEELETENKNKMESIQSLKEEKEAQAEKINAKQTEWEQSVSEYKKLLLLMYKCKNLNGHVKYFGMDATKEGNDYQSVVSFINLFGSEITFASLLYRFYEEVSKVGSLTLCLPLDFHNPLHYSPLRLIFLSNFCFFSVLFCTLVV